MTSIPPNQNKPKRKSPWFRFWEKVDILGVDECWKWTAAHNKRGYGNFGWSSGISNSAHRFAYEFTYTPIPAGLVVCHTCDNPPCCNPNHLFLGTDQENIDDMVKKGRQFRGKAKSVVMLKVAAHGGTHYKAKFTEEQVAEIRRLYVPRVMSLSMIAAQYGVAIKTIHHIIKRETWKHVP